MQPTPCGEVLVRYARRVLTDFGTAREELAALRSGLHGALRVGSVPGALPQLLAPVLAHTSSGTRAWPVSVVVEPAT